MDREVLSEFRARVWGGMAVGDDALTSCIHELRGAMGDDARRPAAIETRHRRGYRLTGGSDRGSRRQGRAH
jgi:DNA-binding winged helix-turn-helix (wHTH) protein